MTSVQIPQEAVETARQNTLAVLADLVAAAGQYNLPEPPPNVAASLARLKEDTYQVLVAGEAKRGKSTFINALIGRPVLPTDVEIATCQVFLIRRAGQEAYRICFEDGSTRAVTSQDLPAYGSQAVVDRTGPARLDQMIRWIEVDVPAKFLPKGVQILDTPGLGSLYAAHAQITQRFVPLADAVIFVLDSEQPIVQGELEFIEKILTVTPNLFFIQTKIDLHRRDHWQAIQQRNQAILAERFGERLVDCRVWPVSSTNLTKAALTGDEDYLIVSRHRELAVALRGFLFRVAGWSRAAQCLFAAEYYHGLGRQVLAERAERLRQDSQKTRAASQQQAQQRKQQFEAEWGERSPRRQELLARIQRVLTVGKQGFREALQPGGTIESRLREKIDAVETVEAAKQVGDGLAEDTLTAVFEQWRQVCDQTQSQLTALLAPFLEDTQTIHLQSAASLSDLNLKSSLELNVQSDWWTKVKGMRGELYQATGTLQIATSILGIAAPGLALAVAAVWGLYAGWKCSTQNQVRSARQELARHLSEVLQEVRQFFFNVDLETGRLSLMDETFGSLGQAVQDQIHQMVVKKSAEAQQEYNRLVEETRLSDQQRQKRYEQACGQLQDWDGLGQRMQAAAAELKALDEVLGRQPLGA